MSWLYTPLYLALLVVCFTQSFYPIFMLVAMLVRESRILYPFFHKVDTTSKRHGGELVARVLKTHGVDHIYNVPSLQVAPIIEASKELGIESINVRDEATAVFDADAAARKSGIPGVAVVASGAALASIVNAVRNAQIAESPIIVIACAATMLKNHSFIQDIKLISLLKTATKKSFKVDCVRGITPTLREAFRLAQVGVSGPVFVEIPVDILHPYSIVADRYVSLSSVKTQSKELHPFIRKLVDIYRNYRLNYIFADAWKTQDIDPLPITVKPSSMREISRVDATKRHPGRPLIHILREQDRSLSK